jgi:hypothetical protein
LIQEQAGKIDESVARFYLTSSQNEAEHAIPAGTKSIGITLCSADSTTPPDFQYSMAGKVLSITCLKLGARSLGGTDSTPRVQRGWTGPDIVLARKILFLVDRKALAAQAVREFNAFKYNQSQKVHTRSNPFGSLRPVPMSSMLKLY